MTLSTPEAEVVAMADTIKETLLIRCAWYDYVVRAGLYFFLDLVRKCIGYRWVQG